jgi:hypothetical protein
MTEQVSAGAALSVGYGRLPGLGYSDGYGPGVGCGCGCGCGQAGPLAPPGHGGAGQAEQGEPGAEQHEAEQLTRKIIPARRMRCQPA